jgi:hypothetical protein
MKTRLTDTFGVSPCQEKTCLFFHPHPLFLAFWLSFFSEAKKGYLNRQVAGNGLITANLRRRSFLVRSIG